MDDTDSDLIDLELCRREYILNIRKNHESGTDLGYSAIPTGWTGSAFYRFNARWSLAPLKDFLDVPDLNPDHIGFLAQTLFTTMNHNHLGYWVKRADMVEGSYKEIEDFLVSSRLLKIDQNILKYNAAAHAYSHFLTMWIQKAYSVSLGMNGKLPMPEQKWVFDEKNDYIFRVIPKI